mmetsp:Transcript_0/g.1  ORF Transcript_0/g.1 Transcript_0/m.1 type:complete len:482 (-) Transcript_0:244-1689(-)
MIDGLESLSSEVKCWTQKFVEHRKESSNKRLIDELKNLREILEKRRALLEKEIESTEKSGNLMELDFADFDAEGLLVSDGLFNFDDVQDDLFGMENMNTANLDDFQLMNDDFPSVMNHVIEEPARKKRVANAKGGKKGAGKKKVNTKTKKIKKTVLIKVKFLLNKETHFRGIAAIDSESILITQLKQKSKLQTGNMTADDASVQKNNDSSCLMKKKIVTISSRAHEADGPLIRSNVEAATTENLWKWLEEYRFRPIDENLLLKRVSADLDRYQAANEFLGSPLLSSLLTDNDIQNIYQCGDGIPLTDPHAPKVGKKEEQQAKYDKRKQSLSRRIVAALLPPPDTLTGNCCNSTISFHLPPQPPPDNTLLYDQCLAQSCLDAGLIPIGDSQNDIIHAQSQDSLIFVRARSVAAHLRKVADLNSPIALQLATKIKIDKANTQAKRRNYASLENAWRRYLKKQQDLAKRKKLEAKQSRKPFLPW